MTKEEEKRILSHNLEDTAGWKLMQLEERNREFLARINKKRQKETAENAEKRADSL